MTHFLFEIISWKSDLKPWTGDDQSFLDRYVHCQVSVRISANRKILEESDSFIQSEIPYNLVVFYHHHQVRKQKSYTEVYHGLPCITMLHDLEPGVQTRIGVNPQMNFGDGSRRLFV